MYNCQHPLQQTFFRRATDPNGTYQIYKIEPIHLGEKAGTERLVLYTSSVGGLKAKAEIQKYDASKKEWVVEYSKEAVGIPYFHFLAGYWGVVEKFVVVLYANMGSGSYLDYTVLGRKRGTLQTIVDRNEIFQGAVWFEGIKLIEASGLRQKVWVNRNRELVLTPFKIPIIPGAHVIEFSISKDGKVNIAKTEYKISMGGIVQLIRTDLQPMVERTLFSTGPDIRYIPHRNALQINGKAKAQITILPGGYDWPQAVNITVTAG